MPKPNRDLLEPIPPNPPRPTPKPREDPKAPPTPPPPSIDDIYCYRNYRPGVDKNTCGQAAIASIVDFWGKNPWNLPRTSGPWNGTMRWSDGQVIDAIRAEFPPDVVFGLFGTSGGQIRNALRAYGFPHARVEYSGLFSAGWQERWTDLRRNVQLGRPVPVLVDVGKLGGSWFGGHWPIVHRIASGNVYLGAMGGNRSNYEVSEAKFKAAWHCPSYPLGYNHCAVFTHRAGA